MSRTFSSRPRKNTPLRLLALVPLQPKSLDPPPELALVPGLHWVVTGKVVDFQHGIIQERENFERGKITQKKNIARIKADILLKKEGKKFPL